MVWILTQAKWGLLGLVVAIVVVSVGVMMLSRSATVPVWVAPGDVDDLNRLLAKVHGMRVREQAERAEAGREEEAV
jgi:hypothetical protein